MRLEITIGQSVEQGVQGVIEVWQRAERGETVEPTVHINFATF